MGKQFQQPDEEILGIPTASRKPSPVFRSPQGEDYGKISVAMGLQRRSQLF
jgi:hypothetical protein